MDIKEIVLTGGPCGGKTKSIAHLRKKLKSKEIQVFTPPEIATLLSENGLGTISAISAQSRAAYFQIGEQILLEQISLMKCFKNCLEIFSQISRTKKRGSAIRPRTNGCNGLHQ